MKLRSGEKQLGLRSWPMASLAEAQLEHADLGVATAAAAPSSHEPESLAVYRLLDADSERQVCSVTAADQLLHAAAAHLKFAGQQPELEPVAAARHSAAQLVAPRRICFLAQAAVRPRQSCHLTAVRSFEQWQGRAQFQLLLVPTRLLAAARRA